MAQEGAADGGSDAVPAGRRSMPSPGTGRRVCDIGLRGRSAGHRPGGRGGIGRTGGRDRHLGAAGRAGAGQGAAGPALRTCTFVVGDVQTGGLGSEPFDLVVSQLGVMFFDEPLAAFGAIRGGIESRRSLRLRLVAGRGAESVAHGHRSSPIRPAPAPPCSGQEPGRDRSASATMSTCATSWAAPGSATSRAGRSKSPSGLPPAQWSTARCSGSWASMPNGWVRPRRRSTRISHGSQWRMPSTSTRWPSGSTSAVNT